jgi:predicted nucleic acid-binding protein
LTRLAVDASVMAKWVLREPDSEKLRSVVTATDELVAPDLLWSELASVLWKHQRRGMFSADHVRRMLRDLLGLSVRTLPVREHIGEVLGYASGLDHSPYGCAYLAIADAEGCRLLTADRRFYDALARSAFADRALWLGDVT